MTIVEAAIQVMRLADRPLTAREAYDAILSQDLYIFRAQDPLSVLRGQIRRHCSGLDFPSSDDVKYFELVGGGRFKPLDKPIHVAGNARARKDASAPSQLRAISLPASLEAIRAMQRRHSELLRERIVRDLKRLSPAEFERFARRLLAAYGFHEVRVTGRSGDGGIDGEGLLRAGLADMRAAFQCKRYTNRAVGRPEVNEFRGASQGRYEQGIYFTTSRFTDQAAGESIKAGAIPILLIDGDRIARLMIEEGLGVQEENIRVYSYALDDMLAEEA